MKHTLLRLSVETVEQLLFDWVTKCSLICQNKRLSYLHTPDNFHYVGPSQQFCQEERRKRFERERKEMKIIWKKKGSTRGRIATFWGIPLIFEEFGFHHRSLCLRNVGQNAA